MGALTCQSFSGLTLAHKIQNTMKMEDRVEHVIYEKNEDIGGYGEFLLSLSPVNLTSRLLKDLVREPLPRCHV